MKTVEKLNGDITLSVTGEGKYLKFVPKPDYMLSIPMAGLKTITGARFVFGCDQWIFYEGDFDKTKYVMPAEQIIMICEEEK